MARPRAFDEATALQKARDTFWQRGYAGTSVDDLVASTGLNRASLYATFGDKHQLYLRALDQYQAQTRQDLLAVTADLSQPALYHLRQILELTARHARTDELRRGCFLVNSTTELLPHDPDTQALVTDNHQFLEALLVGVLTRGQQRGEVRSTATPLAQARFLMSVLNGMLVMAKATPDPQAIQDIANTTLLALA